MKEAKKYLGGSEEDFEDAEEGRNQKANEVGVKIDIELNKMSDVVKAGQAKIVSSFKIKRAFFL